MTRFTWAILCTCVAVAGVALAQQSDSRQSDPSRARPRGGTRGAFARTAAPETPRAGKAVSLNFIIVEINKAGEHKPAIDLSNAEKLPELLRGLEERGEASVITRLRLSSLEHNPCTVQIGETRPLVTGRAGPAPGRNPRGEDERPRYSYQMTNVGMLVTAVSRVESDDSIVADVQIESSRLAANAKPQSDDPIAARRTTTLQTKSTVRIPKGRGVVLSASQSAGDDESRETLILVSGHVEQSASAAAPEKSADPRKAAAKQADASPTEEVRVFSLQNASASQAADVLLKLSTGRTLSIAPDKRTNALIVRGDARQLDEIASLIRELDRGE